MRILIDMDGIVADLLGKWLRVYNEAWNDDLDVSRVMSFALHESVKPDCGSAVYSFLDRADFFCDLGEIDGAMDAVKYLRERHQVRFATAAANPDSAKCKLEWLREHFLVFEHDVFICHDKHWIDADLLIDDRPETLREWSISRRTMTATIAYPYNEEVSGIVNCYARDWRDTERAWRNIVASVDAWSA